MLTVRLTLHCGKAHALEHGGGTVSLQIGQELFGGLGVGSSLQHSGGVDDLTEMCIRDSPVYFTGRFAPYPTIQGGTAARRKTEL